MAITFDLGSFFGILLPAAVAYGLYHKRKRDKRRRLRKAFLQEIGLTLDVLDEIEGSDALAAGEAPGYRVTTGVYDSAGSQLGILTDDEVEAIVNFYAMADNMRWQVQQLGSGHLGSDIPENNVAATVEFGERAMDQIRSASGLDYEPREVTVSREAESQGSEVARGGD